MNEIGVPYSYEVAVLVPVDPPTHGQGRAARKTRRRLFGDIDVKPPNPDAITGMGGAKVANVVAGPVHVHAGQSTAAAAFARGVGRQPRRQARAFEEARWRDD